MGNKGIEVESLIIVDKKEAILQCALNRDKKGLQQIYDQINAEINYCDENNIDIAYKIRVATIMEQDDLVNTFSQEQEANKLTKSDLESLLVKVESLLNAI